MEPNLLTPAEVAALFRVERTSESFARRVLSRIDVSGDCWEWTGTIDAAGYGILGRGRRGAGNIAAHRAVHELLVGPIPNGMQFDHLCRNHACVNPDHGEIVSPDENKQRGYGVGRMHAARTHCNHGHPLDGTTGARGGPRHRYCKTCARTKVNAYRHAKKGTSA